jgi:hypothetical protein
MHNKEQKKNKYSQTKKKHKLFMVVMLMHLSIDDALFEPLN